MLAHSESQLAPSEENHEIPVAPIGNAAGSSSEDTKDSIVDPDLLKKEETPILLGDFKRVLLMGIALKLGGCVLTWNWGLAPGFYEFFLGFLAIACGYLMLGLCMAEILSIMTFDGGYYGYARVILGPLGGYLVGCSGLIESVFAFSGYILKITQLFQIYFDISNDYQKLMWGLCYIGVMAFHFCFTGKLFWNMVAIIAIAELIIIGIYLFSSMPYLDFQKNALQVPANGSGFSKDVEFYLNDFRLAIVFFNTFDLLTLTSSEVKDAKKSMPRAIMALIIFMFVFSIWLIFTVVSQDPGEKGLLKLTTFFPLVFGFEHRFGISYKNALVIAALPIFMTALIYFYLVIKQFKSMASSNLLPSFLLYTIKWERFNTPEYPVISFIVLCSLAFGANYFVSTVNILTTSARMAGLATCFVYLAMFYCYVVFKNRYGHMERTFVNPLGWVAAAIGSLVFLLLLIIIVAFDYDLYANVTIFYTVYMGIMLVYYYAYAESRQKFSLSEQKVFFRAYIVKMHRRKRKTVFQKFFDDVIEFLSPVFPCLRYCMKEKKTSPRHKPYIYPTTESNDTRTKSSKEVDGKIGDNKKEEKPQTSVTIPSTTNRGSVYTANYSSVRIDELDKDPAEFELQ